MEMREKMTEQTQKTAEFYQCEKKPLDRCALLCYTVFVSYDTVFEKRRSP